MRHSLSRPLLYGISLTAFLASLGFILSVFPILNQIGPLAIAILLAVLFRHFLGYPETVHAGVQFSSKQLLRAAIVLYGLKLNMDMVLNDGVSLLFRDLVVVLFAIGLMFILAKLFRADRSLSVLLGIGTGVCGASAIAAVSPILKVKEEDTAISAGLISIVGTIFAIGYTLLRPILPLEQLEYGMWAGLSLHEVAQVALAGAAGGESGLGIALLTKLGRVFLLVPLSLILVWWMGRKRQNHKGKDAITFPWFLLGFIAMSVIGSYFVTIPENILHLLSKLTTFLLTMAMVGFGLNVSIKELKKKALKPLILLIFTSILLSIVTYWMV